MASVLGQGRLLPIGTSIEKVATVRERTAAAAVITVIVIIIIDFVFKNWF